MRRNSSLVYVFFGAGASTEEAGTYIHLGIWGKVEEINYSVCDMISVHEHKTFQCSTLFVPFSNNIGAGLEFSHP